MWKLKYKLVAVVISGLLVFNPFVSQSFSETLTSTSEDNITEKKGSTQTAETKRIEIPAGTKVIVTTTSDLFPENLEVGDSVELAVAKDVVVDGVTVISKGAKAKGEIVISKKNNLIGIPGKIGLKLKSVKTVNNKYIQISGSKHVEGKDNMVVSIGLSLICCLLFALMRGGEASIESGTKISGHTNSNVNLDI